MKKIILLGLCALWSSVWLGAQQAEGQLSGQVIEIFEDESTLELIGANLHWLGTDIGTFTDADGRFTIKRVAETSILVASYTGYRSDTIETAGLNDLKIILEATIVLDGVEVVHRRKSTEVSLLDAIKVEKISERELLKAACCNLSESFETSPSVDVSFTDAITGTRQIQMLGLAGPYSQITRENIPEIRGLASNYGMTFTPGTWIESIQLNKGAGSVVNGFESISGQINIELRKPEEADKLYLNLYANEGGRLEVNANYAQKIKDSDWSTALLLHGKDNSVRHDRNGDGFLDMPLGKTLVGLNRWKYIGTNGLMFQAGIKGTYSDKIGGEKAFDTGEGSNNLWGFDLNIQRVEAWAKIGKVYVDLPWKSIALQVAASSHIQESTFGSTIYDGEQKSFYGNFIYQNILSNTNHKFKTGVSFQYDDYTEVLNSDVFDRKEYVPGAYFEYSFENDLKFNLISGIRVDHHNLYGLFITPRLHARYGIGEESALRFSFGRGLRTASIIAENSGLLASSRDFVIQSVNEDLPYGLDAETAWNYGLNFTHCFYLDYREGTFSIDFYRTDFQNQIVVDMDQTARSVFFYNLDGKSYSNSIQAQLDYEVLPRLDIRLAYRWFDVQTSYGNQTLQKPLLAKHRAFINLAYNTRNKWSFDYTLNWQGNKRIPFTGDNPEAFQLADRSPDFFVMNAQISKNWNDKFEVYLGMENMAGYQQENPIIANEEPNGKFFDASMIWGPLFGRNTYVGFRYWLR